MQAHALTSISCAAILAGTLPASAACIDLKDTRSFSFEGTLSFSIFAGPPNYDDVRKGDVPEPGYIPVSYTHLTLPTICSV